VALVYERNDGSCPEESSFRDAVLSRLGYDPFVVSDERVARVRFRVVPSAVPERRYEAVVEIGTARRALRDASCANLLGPAALAFALGVDPMASLGSGPPMVEPPPASPAVPPPREEATPEAPKAPEPGPVVRWRAGLALFGSVGTAPSATGGAALTFGAEVRSISIELEGRAELPGSESVGRGTIQSQLLSLGVLPCVHSNIAALCLLARMGTLFGEGEGVTSPASDHSLYLAVGGRVGVEVPISDAFALGGFVEAYAEPLRTALRLGDTEVWTSPLVGASAGMGVIGHIP
jgi:hypothetical protein